MIKQKELVAFPTETVYGLGADAFCVEAVEKIFKVKGRPAENPLLVHVSSMEQAMQLVSYLSEDALRLMKEFWPGPLSMVLPASKRVPDIVRGGKAGVGLRMPAHPVALRLIEQAGPLAAPSANKYGRPSPVTADHVRTDLHDQIAAVLNAGTTGVGVESTLIDLQNDYKILRLGGIALEAIQDVLGREVKAPERRPAAQFAADLEVILAENYEQLSIILDDCIKRNKKTALVNNNYQKGPNKSYTGLDREYQLDLISGGAVLYSLIRECESDNVDVLVFAPLPADLTGIAASFVDRIQRAVSARLEN
ncbi:tsac protein [hydrocarbon metagenome]|uniref:L-threonylcarbamoyladenylate synthase n=1 Tax=hydrocarbon metagenome TaxID=938273 RepID=A0A0W8E9H4_9ZZZZ